MTTDRFRVEDLDLAELVGQAMVLPIYGGSTANVTTEQAAANRSIYGATTPREVIEQLRPGGVLLLDRIPFHPHFAKFRSATSSRQLTSRSTPRSCRQPPRRPQKHCGSYRCEPGSCWRATPGRFR